MNKTAVIASPVEAYKCIQHGKTGLHAAEKHEWFECMDKLVTDEKYRKALGEASNKDVLANYDIKKNAILWVNAYQDIVDKYKKKNGGKRYYNSEE